ncbi:MAG: hypothetical protein OZ929_17585 [Bryobacterales bacterium]|nr:hypothetical protein [Bryobacterales bacterium]
MRPDSTLSVQGRYCAGYREADGPQPRHILLRIWYDSSVDVQSGKHSNVIAALENAVLEKGDAGADDGALKGSVVDAAIE